MSLKIQLNASQFDTLAPVHSQEFSTPSPYLTRGRESHLSTHPTPPPFPPSTPPPFLSLPPPLLMDYITIHTVPLLRDCASVPPVPQYSPSPILHRQPTAPPISLDLSLSPILPSHRQSPSTFSQSQSSKPPATINFLTRHPHPSLRGRYARHEQHAKLLLGLASPLLSPPNVFFFFLRYRGARLGTRPMAGQAAQALWRIPTASGRSSRGRSHPTRRA